MGSVHLERLSVGKALPPPAKMIAGRHGEPDEQAGLQHGR